MAILIACLGSTHDSWGPVLKLASMPDWEHVFFVGSASARDVLEANQRISFVAVDEKQNFDAMIAQIQKEISPKVFGEAGVSLYSGSGLLHMAVLSAILKAGGGVKLVHYTDRLVEL